MSPDSSPASRPVEILQGLPAREYIGSHRQSGWLNDGMPAVLIAMTFHEDRRAPWYPPSGPAIPFLWAVGLQRAAHLSNGMSLYLARESRGRGRGQKRWKPPLPAGPFVAIISKPRQKSRFQQVQQVQNADAKRGIAGAGTLGDDKTPLSAAILPRGMRGPSGP